MSQAYRSLVTAVQFLTRLKTPDIGPSTPADLAGSAAFYPVVGVIVGMLLAVLALFVHIVYTNLIVTAVIVVAADAWITGGLHLDGLMDSADGLLSYRSRERALSIMRDAHVGAMAVLVALFTLLLRIVALSSLSPVRLAQVVFVAAVFARSLLLLVMRYAPTARSDGRGYESAQGNYTISGWLAMLLSLLLVAVLFGAPGLLACAVVVLGVGQFTAVCTRRLGGMTGDTYGATIELAQLLFTLVLAARGMTG